MKSINWTTEEINLIKSDKSIQELIPLLPNRTKKAIGIKIGRIKNPPIRKKYYFEWNKYYDTLVKSYTTSNCFQFGELCEKLGIKTKAARIYLNKHGIKKPDNFKIYQRISNIVPLLEETNEAYYWAGFIAADGSIKKNNQLVISLGFKDKHHLEKLTILLNSKLRIGTAVANNKKYPIVTTSAADMFLMPKFAEKFNFKKNKTYNPPDLHLIFAEKNKDLLLSFIIGYIDGDGCINNEIRIDGHYSWLQFHKFIFNTFNNLNKLTCSPPKLNKRNYSHLYLPKIVAQFLKSKIIELSLPAMERKWNSVNLQPLTIQDI